MPVPQELGRGPLVGHLISDLKVGTPGSSPVALGKGVACVSPGKGGSGQPQTQSQVEETSWILEAWRRPLRPWEEDRIAYGPHPFKGLFKRLSRPFATMRFRNSD